MLIEFPRYPPIVRDVKLAVLDSSWLDSKVEILVPAHATHDIREIMIDLAMRRHKIWFGDGFSI